MKHLLFFFLAASVTFSQVVTTDPLFPTEADNILITFNAQQAVNQSLVGYQGDVYAHTGVTTSINGGTENKWQHVIESWGNNTTQPRLTRIAQDLYQMEINNARQFYSVTNANEIITQLCFVFRSSDASMQTEDIFVEIFSEGLNVQIAQPESLPIFPLINSQVDFTITSNTGTNIKLYIDEVLVSEVNDNTLNFSYNVSSAGRKKVKATAIDNGGNTASDSSYIIARNNVPVANLPAGVEEGINYIDANTVTLVLYAPFKEFVYLIGDFNDWEFAPEGNDNWDFDYDYYFNTTPDNTAYWITLTSLTPQEEYGFQYLVDGELRIPDPYADKILDPWNDNEISSSTYPDLKPYPTDYTTNIVSVFQTGQDEYQWQIADFEQPANTDLIIYELLLRDFVSTHSYRTLIDTLDYFVSLGINAIELMPVSEFEGNNSWGYNPMMYFAPDKYYGTKNDLKAFIDAAHQKGIAVILDMVLNHSYGLNPLVRLYFDGTYPTAENPWFNITAPHTCFGWGFDIDHESQATQDFMDRVTSYWLTEYKFDGFRFDFTKGFTNTPSSSGNNNCGSSRDDSRITILKRMADEIWEIDPDAYVILEHFAADSEEAELADYGMMIWGNLNYNYNEATMGFNTNSDFSRVSYLERGWTQPNLVGYMESHDEERLMFKNFTYGNSSGSYDIQNYTTALNRMKLAAAFFFTIPGPKMIWQFSELGYDLSINYPSGTENDRLTPKPPVWYYLDEYGRQMLSKFFSALINIKKNHNVFRSDDFTISANGTVKSIHINHADMDISIIGNFDVVEQSINPNFQRVGTWYDFFTGQAIQVNDTQEEVNLLPGEFHIYSTEPLPTPEEGIYSDVEIFDTGLPVQYFLSQNYPNPFNPSTTINYSIKEPGFVTITIYNLLGQTIKTLVEEEKETGFHETTWFGINDSGIEAASGIYFYTINTKDFFDVKKLTLIR